MRRRNKDITIVYEQVKVSPEEAKKRLNEVYDILFTEAIKFMKTNEYKALKAKKNK